MSSPHEPNNIIINIWSLLNLIKSNSISGFLIPKNQRNFKNTQTKMIISLKEDACKAVIKNKIQKIFSVYVYPLLWLILNKNVVRK